MSTKNITPFQNSLQASAGFPPAPPEAHHPAGEGKTKTHGLEIGDVLYSSWGYDQTNIDYYQVVELVGKTMVSVRKIACEREQIEWEQGRSVPAINEFIGEPMRRKVKVFDSTGRGSISITSYAWAYPLEFTEINGMRVYKSTAWSSYA